MGHKIRKYFFSGLVVFLPVTLTFFLFIWTLNFADNLLGRYLRPIFLKEFGFYFKGLGLMVTLSLIFFCGFVVTNYLGRKLHSFFENIILRIPFFRQVYPAIKEIVTLIFSQGRISFQQVVFIEYPRKGIHTLAFLTNEKNGKASKILRQDILNVFVPTSPSPLTGFVVLVTRGEVTFTDIPVEDAVRFVVSGGVLNPEGNHLGQ